MAKTVKIDLRDHAGVPAGGAGMRRDRVTVWAPTFRPATGGDWTVGPQPVDYYFEDGVVNIPDVDAGPLVVRFDVDQMDGVDTFTVTVPAGDGVISMRELLADQYEYAPIVISEARRVLAEARVLLEQSQDSASASKSSQDAAASSATAAKSSQNAAASSASEAKAQAGVAKTEADRAAQKATEVASTVEGNYSPVGHRHQWSEIDGKPTVFPPDEHTHTTAQVTGLDTALAGKASQADMVALQQKLAALTAPITVFQGSHTMRDGTLNVNTPRMYGTVTITIAQSGRENQAGLVHPRIFDHTGTRYTKSMGGWPSITDGAGTAFGFLADMKNGKSITLDPGYYIDGIEIYSWQSGASTVTKISVQN